MNLAVVYSRAQIGIESPQVTVEVHLTKGLPSLSIVGLPETAVRESKDRVRSALINNHYDFPLKRITINLAPADLPKEGGRYDLAIAIGILAASGQLPREDLEQYEFVGELALSGELRPIRGILPATMAIKSTGRSLILPGPNAREASLVSDINLYNANTIAEVCAHLSNIIPIEKYIPDNKFEIEKNHKDLSDVLSQHQAKRALTIAAAGSHSMLMIGPPGTGKTMLAERLASILPPMTEEQALETAAITSISGHNFDSTNWKKAPFRSPHHTASAVALVGGGSHPRPGEISLAHNGVLFLDELPEFDRKVLEVLREPLESGLISISRAAQQAEFPSRFQLVAAMNPCPCGYLGDTSNRCQCNEDQVLRYRNRISGPLLDRIDLQIEVPNITHRILDKSQQVKTISSEKIREKVVHACSIQLKRCGKSNSRLENREIEKYCGISEEHKRLLQSAIERLGLSTRGLHRILKIARTIADLSDADEIEKHHLTEALSYRCLDRNPG